MHRSYRSVLRGGALLVAAALAGACGDTPDDTPVGPSRAAPLANETEAVIPSVNLRLVMDTITRGMIADSTHEYYAPGSTAMNRFRQAVDSVMAGKISVADSLVGHHFYDVYRVRESTTGDTLVIFRERLAANDTVRYGWGTYIFNPRAAVRADIHVNHPISDQHTEDIGIELYRDCRCRWFLVAGAERDANPQFMVSDVAHATNTIFQAVSTRLAAANVRVVSVHGFVEAGHPDLPDGVDQVISNGVGSGYGAAEPNLRGRLEDGGWEAGVFGLTADYDELGGTTNVQGMSWRSIAGVGRWMHLEIEQNVRGSTTAWRAMNAVIQDWLADNPL
ncbi:MAG TPA: hypothetical protein VFX98_16945 [Longimicrobiaceae bacterium]|nr:hypothetical protein [Longimicrobiaceae bacterium]